jgi:hypothetical protein
MFRYYIYTYLSFAITVSQLKLCDFSGETFKCFKCYNFLWVRRRHKCSPVANFANSVMTLHLLQMHLQTFLSTIPQFIQSTTQHTLAISIKNLATCFGSLNHPQANFSKHSTGTFSEYAYYGIPYCLQIILPLKLMLNFVSRCIIVNIYIYITLSIYLKS